MLCFLFLHCSGPVKPSENPSGDGGVAAKKCTTSDSCPKGSYCTGGKVCHPRCKGDKDCKDLGLVCRSVSGQCVDCVQASDCKKDHTCRRFRCFADKDCRSSKSCPSDQVCDLKEKKCVECLSPNDCETGEVCEQGVCLPQPPKCVSHKDCKTFGQVCNARKARCVDCLTDDDCDTSNYCKQELCVATLCKRSEKRCIKGLEAFESCKANGSGWEQVQTCPAETYCEIGECLPQKCSPATKRCEAGKVATCNDRGDGFLTTQSCPSGEYCKEGSCLTMLCKPNTKTCESGQVKLCNNEGSSSTLQDCKAKEFCEKGVCRKALCNVGEKKCESNKSKICKSDGSGWEIAEDCGAKKYCEQGKCKARVCVPGTMQCSNVKTLQICNPKGVSWIKQSCGKNEYCNNKKCVKGKCPEGKKASCYSGSFATKGVGACQAGGQVCNGGKWGKCVGEVTPIKEACNGFDDDCDGKVDGMKKACYNGPSGTAGKGICQAGTELCNNGIWEACTGEVKPKTETCNNKDDDCDGKVDGDSAGGGVTCGTGKKGVCGQGLQSCVKGKLECKQVTMPSPEVCDSVDNDCDGQVNEGLTCAPPCLVYQPKALDFGSTKVGCSSPEIALKVTNTCPKPHLIKQVGFNSSAGSSFRMVSINPILPVTLSTGQSLSLVLRFSPKKAGIHSGALQLMISTIPSGRLDIFLKGIGASASSRTDSFTVSKNNKVDLLFVIDNSCSMRSYQTALGSAFPSFIAAAQQLKADYQIGIVSTDVPRGKGLLQGNPKIIKPSTPDLVNKFKRNARLGTSGSANEQGLESARLALSPKVNLGFIRPNAHLSLIFVSDEPDFSKKSVQSYISFFKSLKQSIPSLKILASALGPKTASSCQRTKNCRYYATTKALGGLFQHIKGGSLGSFMQKLAQLSLGVQKSFLLKAKATPSSIIVKVNGVLVGSSATHGWLYDNSSNQVTLYGSFAPKGGEKITITYNAFCTP